nr:XERICO [Lilium davidii]
MGISSMPTPSDNMVAFLAYYMVLAELLLKANFRSVLRLFGFDVPEPPRMGEWSTKDRFRRHFKPMKFRSVAERSSEDCCVCLVRFQLKCVVNKLECGHVFHRDCLEKWLDYYHVTCPLCRNYVLPREYRHSWWY